MKNPFRSPFLKDLLDNNLLEQVIAWAITAVSIIFHLVFFFNAGGLWRDEVNSVNLVSMPAISEMWENGQYDSFPIFWFIVLRIWSSFNIDGGDSGLRVLGLLTGLALLGVLWYMSRRLLKNPWCPMLTLVLVSINPEIIRWGDSLRAYGLGIILNFLTVVLIWRSIQNPTVLRIAVAIACAVVSVQTLYYNAVLLFAICLGFGIVALRHGRLKVFGAVASIGLISAISLLPYIKTIDRLHQWNMLVKTSLPFSTILNKTGLVLASQSSLTLIVWPVLFILALIAAICSQFRHITPGISEEQRDISLFAGTALAIGSVAYIIFLKSLSYPTEAWYYLSLLVFASFLIEALISIHLKGSLPRLARIALVSAILILGFNNSLMELKQRQTNIDLISADLNISANKHDLVLVTSWETGVTFARYYKGSAPWMTIPPIDDHRFHRYDQVKNFIYKSDPLQENQRAIEKALSSGHCLWVVGHLPSVPEGFNPTRPGNPPLPKTGWHLSPYNHYWILKNADFVRKNSRQIKLMKIGENVNRYENVNLILFKGWHR